MGSQLQNMILNTGMHAKDELPPKNASQQRVVRKVYKQAVSSAGSYLFLSLYFPFLNSYIIGGLPLKVVFHRRLSFTKGCLLPMLVFHQRLSSTEGTLPPKVHFHRRLSSNKGRLPPKVVFHRKSKVVFHWSSSSTDGRHPTKVLFHRRSSSTEEKSWIPADLRRFYFAGRKKGKFENIFFWLKTLISRSNLHGLSSSFLQTSTICECKRILK